MLRKDENGLFWGTGTDLTEEADDSALDALFGDWDPDTEDKD